MYPQSQQGYPYPQQPGYAYPQQPGYAGYPPPNQTGYPGGPTVNLNMGPTPMGGGGGTGGWTDPAGLFAEKAIRQAFVSKVFSILTAQLLFASFLIGFFVLNDDTKYYFARTQGWSFLGFGMVIISFLILACVESARRSTPLNFILLAILTAGYAIVAAVISCRYSTFTVMAAFLATGVSCLLIAAFAKSTSFDMTNCGTTLCLLALAHMIVGFILVLLLPAKTSSLVLAIGGAMLVSLYLVFDIQLIMGGRKCELSPEEYILGAVMLYTDIMQIFIYMLEIMSRLSDD